MTTLTADILRDPTGLESRWLAWTTGPAPYQSRFVVAGPTPQLARDALRRSVSETLGEVAGRAVRFAGDPPPQDCPWCGRPFRSEAKPCG